MDDQRKQILLKAEDNWSVILLSCKQNLVCKKFFRQRFHLELRLLKKYMQPGTILFENCLHSEAKSFEQEIAHLPISVQLVQDGISYRNKFSEEQIVEALTELGTKIEDFIVRESGSFDLEESVLIIENNELRIACLKYLLEIGAPIKPRASW